MAYVKYYSPSLKWIFDEFLLSKYLKSETVFQYLESYLKKHNILLDNVTAVANNGAPAMVDH